ncbi:hypothetical protein SAMN02910377_00662 [Pseudobutyrivibrio ruminis]|uniref:Uncharacterized protein n=1 Tax=Pseudobutyrivibrio ruminis TaxID=46206 RepID=A0A1H7G7I6_9FIRM|nr:tetratricopeptide repeat protein [Pseudobutyrivibrio ruminis]SEK34253.1 hypothetical protein SAMN02910377_00662 [Pseudobutyrivibrio ruminis]
MICINEIALAIGESITASVIFEKTKSLSNKTTLNSIATKIYKECIDVFINKYQNEIYYAKLDNYIERVAYIETLINYMTDITRKNSIEKYIDTIADDFISEYSSFISQRIRIKEALEFLSEEIKRILFQSKICFESLEHNRIYDVGLRNGEKLDQLLEQISGAISFNTIAANKNNMLKICGENDLKDNYYDEIIALLEEGKYVEVIEKIDLYVERFPKDYEMLVDAGALLIDIGRFEEAKEKLDKVLSVDENHVNALYNMAVACYCDATKDYQYNARPDLYEAEKMSKSIDGAVQYIDRAYSVDENDLEVKNFKAYLYMVTKKDLNLAQKLLWECIKEHPDVDYKINLALCYLIDKDFNNALIIAQELCFETKFRDLTEASFIFGLMGNIYATPGIRYNDEAVQMLMFAYMLSHDSNYLKLTDMISNGSVIDSIFINRMMINIYDVDEMPDLVRKNPRDYYC